MGLSLLYVDVRHASGTRGRAGPLLDRLAPLQPLEESARSGKCPTRVSRSVVTWPLVLSEFRFSLRGLRRLAASRI